MIQKSPAFPSCSWTSIDLGNILYSARGVELMFHSFHNAGMKPDHILPKIMPPTAQARAATNGMFILYDPRQPDAGREVTGKQLMDVAPTLLELMGVKPPADMQGGQLLE